MKKDKTRQYETLLDGMFPQCFPRGKKVGKQKQDEQPTLDEIWEWLGNPDEY